MIALEEAEYSDACWEGDRGCAFPASIVNVAVSKGFAEAASQEMLDFIDAYSIDGDLMSGLLAFMQANDAEAADAATEFLQSRTDLWTTWVSNDAACRVLRTDAAVEGIALHWACPTASAMVL